METAEPFFYIFILNCRVASLRCGPFPRKTRPFRNGSLGYHLSAILIDFPRTVVRSEESDKAQGKIYALISLSLHETKSFITA